ncbi:hypothetical protein BJF86_11945 [Serinicoccus sp. CNJ-927]|nr:hypothetical protein BJF86_11945 [Serinicoccus sp. CNJ-927]
MRIATRQLQLVKKFAEVVMPEAVAITVLVGTLVAVLAGFLWLVHRGCKPRVLEQYVALAARGMGCLSAVIIVSAGAPYAVDAALNAFEVLTLE